MSTKVLTTTRRAFLKKTAASAAVSALPAWTHEPAPVPLEQYQSQFFTADEWAFILAATARLIPSEGDGPGAIEARVPVFIDLQLAGDFGKGTKWYLQGPHDPNAPPQLGYQSPLPPAEAYRAGIANINDWCRSNHGRPFVELSPKEQNDVLTGLDNNQIVLTSTLGVNFFDLLLQNTKEGYFADPMYGGNCKMSAWVHIGFPGARASFREWVGVNKPYPLGPVTIAGERA
ncbi:gluconate 2-dehydrogenase subunit 3 family protein [Bradyrhizobium sp. LMTR 3]|uniref:gluconate 2-dehydrogenase subunit 3 family protein n=1 Tax=Bradyrhizobium sp. LMTR 3 TaxID=189873 RepID=UPI000810C9AB|nr:gluconate 2-dehydrogenase subunit 3 family protein [Bradyrhizobium sp. LMTR 3]OCK58281.1 gluconate 2-dehydrogenase [Bradyrhizobium sp. LMTR 3]